MGGEDPTGILSGAASGIAQNIEEAVTLPGSLVLWSPNGQTQDAGKKLVVITDLAMREREKSATSPGGTTYQFLMERGNMASLRVISPWYNLSQWMFPGP